MIFYFDENIPKQLPKALNILCREHEIFSTVEKFGSGEKDEILIPEIAKQNGILITQDINIKRINHQRELFISENLGIFFIKPPSNKGFMFWDLVKLIIKNWQEIIKNSKKTEKPFAYTFSSRGDIKLLEI